MNSDHIEFRDPHSVMVGGAANVVEAKRVDRPGEEAIEPCGSDMASLGGSWFVFRDSWMGVLGEEAGFCRMAVGVLPVAPGAGRFSLVDGRLRSLIVCRRAKSNISRSGVDRQVPQSGCKQPGCGVT